MFLTTEFARVMNPLLDKDEYGWSQVQLIINAPWYFCCISEGEDEECFNTSVILSNIKLVIDLSNNPKIILKDIYLITPSHINKSNYWKMDKVQKVYKSTNHELKKTSQVYKLLKLDESEIIIEGFFESKDIEYSFEKVIDFELD